MPRFDDKLLAISEGFFRSFNPSLLKSFLFKMDNFSYFFIKLKAKSSSSFELLVSSAISTSHFKNFSLSFSLCFIILTLFSPSTNTFTVPSGNFKSL